MIKISKFDQEINELNRLANNMKNKRVKEKLHEIVPEYIATDTALTGTVNSEVYRATMTTDKNELNHEINQKETAEISEP